MEPRGEPDDDSRLRPGSDPRLVRLVVAIVLGRWDEVREARRRAPAPLPPTWREAILQTHLFAGFPRLVEALEVLAQAGGLEGAPPEELEPPGADDASRAGAGRALFDRIYADRAEDVRGTIAGHHPDLAAWIEQHAYGRVLSRPGLAAGDRELLACACLAALGQDRQLVSHARGALRCGASREDLERSLSAAAQLLGADEHERALRVVRRVTRTA